MSETPKYVSPCLQKKEKKPRAPKVAKVISNAAGVQSVEQAPQAAQLPGLALYHPHGAAGDLWRCKDPEVLIEGPRGTGKTLAVLHKVNALCFKYPGIRVLIVRKTRMSMSETVLADFEKDVLKDHPAYPEFRNTDRGRRSKYDYPNTSIIVVRGMDDMENLRSSNFDVIAAFEATELTEGDWETCLGSLRNYKMPYQQGISDCNPDRPSHWLNARANRLYEVPAELKGSLPEPRPGQMQMTRLLSRHKDNPKFWDHKNNRWFDQGAAYMAVLAKQTGARYERHYLGRWAASEGLVYDFDPLKHVLDYGTKEFPWREIPRDWRRIRVIDFGFTNPFVCQWWAIDPDGRMYLYREIYRAQTTVADHAVKINAWSAGETIEATVADHDAEDRATLHKAGIRTVKAYKAIMVGIEAVTHRLRAAADGKPRLFIMRGARLERDQMLAEAGLPTSTEEEEDGYVYPPSKDNKTNKEEPLDLNNHGMDGKRYAVAYIDDIARRRFKLRGGRVKAQAA